MSLCLVKHRLRTSPQRFFRFLPPPGVSSSLQGSRSPLNYPQEPVIRDYFLASSPPQCMLQTCRDFPGAYQVGSRDRTGCVPEQVSEMSPPPASLGRRPVSQVAATSMPSPTWAPQKRPISLPGSLLYLQGAASSQRASGCYRNSK